MHNSQSPHNSPGSPLLGEADDKYIAVRSSGFLCSKVAYEQQENAGDKGKLFVLFIPLFTLFRFNKIVCSLRQALSASFCIFVFSIGKVHVYNTASFLRTIHILLDLLLCSIAEYFYELCRILTSP